MSSAVSDSVQRLLSLAQRNAVNRELIGRLGVLELPDCYLVSGCLFQTVWNLICGKPPEFGILDYDIFYYDSSDLSWDAEDAVIRRVKGAFPDLPGEIQVRNQARVHLWYEKRFGLAIAPLRSARDGIDHFLVQASCVGVRCGGGASEVYAPFGLDDLFAMILRPNARRDLPEVYYRKVRRWAGLWPGMQVLPWPESPAIADSQA
jgi:hypothetical protein